MKQVSDRPYLAVVQHLRLHQHLRRLPPLPQQPSQVDGRHAVLKERGPVRRGANRRHMCIGQVSIVGVHLFGQLTVSGLHIFGQVTVLGLHLIGQVTVWVYTCLVR